MGKITFITGGARSGKSRHAEELLKNVDNALYIATAIPFDDEMKERIDKHRKRRNSKWSTIEAYKDIDSVYKNHTSGISHILFDCITVMISNLMMMEQETDWDNADMDLINRLDNKVGNEIEKFIQEAISFPGETIIVSNELGMGIVPPTPLGRYFRDIAGKANQQIAGHADEVYFMVSGIPVKIKGI